MVRIGGRGGIAVGGIYTFAISFIDVNDKLWRSKSGLTLPTVPLNDSIGS